MHKFSVNPASITGYRSGLLAAFFTVAYVVVQVLQVLNRIPFPFDELLIYGTSLLIVIPFIFEVLAVHHFTSGDRKYWSSAAMVFTVIYAVFVTANYVVQMATVLPAKINHTLEEVRILDQTPHSLFWNFDAIGYISMGIAAYCLAKSFEVTNNTRRVRQACFAHALMTPLITVVYFYPVYSNNLLLLGFPWGITAPFFMLMVAMQLKSAGSRQ